MWFGVSLVLACLAGGAVLAAEPLDLGVRPAGQVEARFGSPVEIPLDLPGESLLTLHTAESNWVTLERLEVEVFLPAGAPEDVQVLTHVVDWDGFWHQTLWTERLQPAETNRVVVDVSPSASGWEPLGHHGAWHRRCLMEPREVSLRLFGAEGFTGRCEVVSARGIPAAESSPPQIRWVRANSATPPVHGLYELRFDLSDRYANPFDPDEIAVDAQIEQPDGTRVSVPAFYHQDYFRMLPESGERILPQGRPEWRLRYAPRQEGGHRLHLRAVDRMGEAVWGPGHFRAGPAAHSGVVRVSRRDPRFLEHEDGTPFFPIGLNIRSPFDTRMDDQFPWRFRHPEGSSVYARYFRDLGAVGANMVEVWASAWCLGLEWTPTQLGYHGLGQYNLVHAWERDQVFRLAAQEGLLVNLVLNNHGRLSAFCDPEWKDNPYNADNGGYLADPLDWFEDERAIRSYEKQLRYEVARYGWSPHLFAWELWSELDLAGSRYKDRPQFDPRVVAWHQRMGRFLRALDLQGHLVSTHVSQDFGKQNPELVKVPELDLAAVDAYHNRRDPLEIVRLQRKTAEFNAPFGKPVLITEFGGSPMAADLRHLRLELHAALWSSVATGVAGAPLFWWWQVVEEETLYPMYRALGRFMAGEDRRDPGLQQAQLRILDAGGAPVPGSHLECIALVSPRGGWGWLYAAGPRFSALDPEGDPLHKGFRLLLAGEENAIYRITFWDTLKGEPVGGQDVRIRKGEAEALVPPFVRDMAFKLRRQQ